MMLFLFSRFWKWTRCFSVCPLSNISQTTQSYDCKNPTGSRSSSRVVNGLHPHTLRIALLCQGASSSQRVRLQEKRRQLCRQRRGLSTLATRFCRDRKMESSRCIFLEIARDFPPSCLDL